MNEVCINYNWIYFTKCVVFHLIQTQCVYIYLLCLTRNLSKPIYKHTPEFLTKKRQFFFYNLWPRGVSSHPKRLAASKSNLSVIASWCAYRNKPIRTLSSSHNNEHIITHRPIYWITSMAVHLSTPIVDTQKKRTSTATLL